MDPRFRAGNYTAHTYDLNSQRVLKRLKRDRVDLYLVHEPDQFDLDDEALETFIALKREGVIGAFGLAYGRSVSETSDFGTVIQSKYCDERTSQDDNKTRIFHGVLAPRLE